MLLTAFEPFAGDDINPSWEAAHPLQGWRCDTARVQVVKLPCVFGRAVQEIEAAIHLHRPDVIIGTGLAGGSLGLRLERVAINLDDASIPDNSGNQPRDQAISSDGPPAYFSTLPLRAIEAALLAEGIPAALSYSAGTFVCNHVFYAVMRHLERLGQLQQTPAGFIHLPYLPQQASDKQPTPPSMALDTMMRGLGVAIRTCVESMPGKS